MIIESIRLGDVKVIKLNCHDDHRGYFMRTFDRHFFIENKISHDFVQCNESFSKKKHTIRGLHYQLHPNSETKVVSVSQGSILDVFVDLRKGSKTFGRWDSVRLSALNRKVLCVPKGFAHGFCTLTDNCKVHYLVDSMYNSESEGGILWNDKDLGINWPTTNPIISEKDKSLMTLSTFMKESIGII